MPLTWGDIKHLVRLQAVAEQVAVIALAGDERGTWRDVGRDLGGVLEALVDEIRAALGNADAGLTDEFERIVIRMPGARLPLAARAAILTGWLKGAVEAETLEVRIRVGEDRPRARKVTPGATVPG